MNDGHNRIEPTFEADERPRRGREAGPPPYEPVPEQSEMNAAARVIAVVVAVTCLFFVGDRLYSRYQQYKAMQALEQELQTLGVYMTESLQQAGEASQRLSAQMKARNEAAAREQQERVAEQRRARMATTEGGWLGKNCADWTRSWNQTRAQTAEQEMKKHCGRYERYLETGIAPPGTPRAVNRMR